MFDTLLDFAIKVFVLVASITGSVLCCALLYAFWKEVL